MIEITPHTISNCQVSVPGSKSYTHRMVIAAALADGVSTLKNALISEDTQFTMQALRQMGIRIDRTGSDVRVFGKGGSLGPCSSQLYLGNSGTSMRLITGITPLGSGSYTLTGTERMQERPLEDLLHALRQMGIRTRSLKNNGCPPVIITAGPVKKRQVEIDCQKSSQYLSALLLLAPVTPEGLEIRVAGELVSRPYVALTLALMKTFGIRINHADYRKFEVPGPQRYRAGTYTVEADCSQAAYFWGAAAITGAHITVKDVNANSVQGDLHFLDLLQQMGCTIVRDSAGIGVVGGPLHAIEVDLAHMPDQVPTLAVVAAFAEGTSRIKNIAHLKTKESNRLAATITELNKMGIEAGQSDSTLIVKGGRPRGAVIDTYNDHRIAMSFALAGLKVPGIFIRNEACVTKSFPGFWHVFEELYRS